MPSRGPVGLSSAVLPAAQPASRASANATSAFLIASPARGRQHARGAPGGASVPPVPASRPRPGLPAGGRVEQVPSNAAHLCTAPAAVGPALLALSYTDIPQMGSVGSREAALPFAFGQPGRVSDDSSQLQGAAGPRPAGEFGLLWCQRSIWAHSSPVSFGRHLAPPRQATTTGGPRRRSIRRRFAANNA